MYKKVIKLGRGKKTVIGKPGEIVIQSMCDTKTENIKETIAQIKRLEAAGCEIVRVAIPSMRAAANIKEIKKRIRIPLVADVHFDPSLALAAIKNGADKIRINPGNISNKKDLVEIIKAAKIKSVPIRIGINGGSFKKAPTPKNLVREAIKNIEFFEANAFDNIVISIKSSGVKTVIEANELLYQAMKKRGKLYPIHLGLTEAGPLIPGMAKSIVAMSELLKKGIGNTIRISLTDDPLKEVLAAKELLKALGLYQKEPEIISCPTCGRTEIDLKKLVSDISKTVYSLGIKKPIKIAVMGCVVNGPGEAKHSDYAICGGKGLGAIFAHGKFIKSVPEKKIHREFIKLLQSEK